MDRPDRIVLVEVERRGDRIRIDHRHHGTRLLGWVRLADLTRMTEHRIVSISGGACVAATNGEQVVLRSSTTLFAQQNKGRWGTLAAGSYFVHRIPGSNWASLDHIRVPLDGTHVELFDEPACPPQRLRHAWLALPH
jgi:hypothetical protein